MKIKQNMLDTFAYILACISSLGFWWIVRVVITQAIKMAFEEDKKEKK